MLLYLGPKTLLFGSLDPQGKGLGFGVEKFRVQLSAHWGSDVVICCRDDHGEFYNPEP